MKKAILATKVGMTQIFNADGVLVPVTVLEAGPCSVTQIKTVENDGYSAVQVAYADKKEKVVSKDANGKKEIRNRHGVNKAQIMARTANVFARVEPELKEQAESVLDQLGIPMSNAVGMFLRQIVLQKGIPFEMKLPRTAPLTYGSLTKEQFDKEIEKGMSDVKAGRVYSADAIEAEMKRDFGI